MRSKDRSHDVEGKVQLSLWLTAEENDLMRKAAKAEQRGIGVYVGRLIRRDAEE